MAGGDVGIADGDLGLRVDEAVGVDAGGTGGRAVRLDEAVLGFLAGREDDVIEVLESEVGVGGEVEDGEAVGAVDVDGDEREGGDVLELGLLFGWGVGFVTGAGIGHGGILG